MALNFECVNNNRKNIENHGGSYLCYTRSEGKHAGMSVCLSKTFSTGHSEMQTKY